MPSIGRVPVRTYVRTDGMHSQVIIIAETGGGVGEKGPRIRARPTAIAGA